MKNFPRHSNFTTNSRSNNTRARWTSEQQQRQEGGHSVILTSPSGCIGLLPSGSLYMYDAQLHSHLKCRRFITFWPSICAVDFVIARRERRARDSTVVDLDVFLCDEGINPRFIGITGLSILIRWTRLALLGYSFIRTIFEEDTWLKLCTQCWSLHLKMIQRTCICAR